MVGAIPSLPLTLRALEQDPSRLYTGRALAMPSWWKYFPQRFTGTHSSVHEKHRRGCHCRDEIPRKPHHLYPQPALSSEVTGSGLVLSTDVQDEVLIQASRAIWDYPQVANVQRLRIYHNFRFSLPVGDSLIANEVGSLFETVGALDELTIYESDLRPYLLLFLGPPERRARRPVAVPQVKVLVISHLVKLTEDKGMAIVELAKLQHERVIPFECVAVCRESMSEGVVWRRG